MWYHFRMKQFLRTHLYLFLFFVLPVATFAAPPPGTAEAQAFVDKLNSVILFPTIALLSAVAFFVFLWGTAQYFMNANNDAAREQGVKHITWGIIGLVVMMSAFAILELATSTAGLDNELDCANDPANCTNNPFVVPT